MLTKFAKPAHKLLVKAFATASDLTSATSGTLIRSKKLQFSKKRLTDWGELPPGEIPEALQYDCPHGNEFCVVFIVNFIVLEVRTLDNGVRVATEAWKTNLAT